MPKVILYDYWGILFSSKDNKTPVFAPHKQEAE
jgi:hypothetical protein